MDGIFFPEAVYTPGTISFHPDDGFIICGDDGCAIYVGWGIDLGGFFRNIGRGVEKAVKSVAKVAKDVGRGIEKGVKWIVQRDPFAQTIKAIAEGKRLDRALLEGAKVSVNTLREVGPYAQAVMSVVPGIGTGVSVALGCAIAIANGKPISEVALQAARSALPGGPVAQAAFDTAAALVKGQRLDQALLSAARERLPEAGKAAFDAGLALAQGKNLQQAVTLGARRLLPKGAQAGFDTAISLLNGKNPGDAILAAARQRLPGPAQTAFDAAVSIAKSGRPDAALAVAKAAASRIAEQKASTVLGKHGVDALAFLQQAKDKVQKGVEQAKIPYAVAKQLPGVAEASRVLVRAVQGDHAAKAFVAQAAQGAARGDPRLAQAYRKIRIAKELQKNGHLIVRKLPSPKHRPLTKEEIDHLLRCVTLARRRTLRLAQPY